MPKAKPSKTGHLPSWANEPLKFSFSPDEALRQGAYNRLPASRKKSVKSRMKSR